jgi:hypothetical protein
MTSDTEPSDLASAIAALSFGSDGSVNFLADPRATELIARKLSDLLVDLALDCLVIRDDPQPAVLAHIVARNLGCATMRVYEAEGLVELLDEPTPGARAAVIGERFPTENSLSALIGRARHSGLAVVAIVAVTSSPALLAATASHDAGITHVLDGGRT